MTTTLLESAEVRDNGCRNYSWPIFTKECCRTRGSNPRVHDRLQTKWTRIWQSYCPQLIKDATQYIWIPIFRQHESSELFRETVIKYKQISLLESVRLCCILTLLLIGRESYFLGNTASRDITSNNCPPLFSRWPNIKINGCTFIRIFTVKVCAVYT